ncbi:hypothetical protein LXL04_037719 [Taraxacum kok-saghyz]
MAKFSCCFGGVVSPRGGGVHRVNNRGSNTDISVELLDINNMRLYTYKDLQTATQDFNPDTKIGQGGFGSVYKGLLKDGKLVAIKVLSTESRQGLREFLTEITVISDIQHENLVKLHGYCVEKDHRILVYGYLKNGSLDRTLLDGEDCGIKFTWEIRRKICIGVAKGLAYLHEEVQPHVIHRDIKASNILLDEDFTPKISDFGLAKLFPSHLTHVSTRIAGTQGYLAPEYAIRGQLTRKADIYSFGVLLLEIVSGRPNQSKLLPIEKQYLLEWVWELYSEGELKRSVDGSIGTGDDIDEACRYLKIGLLCTQSLPKNRPSMSNVMMLLNDETALDEKDLCDPGMISELTNFKTSKNNTTGGTSSSGGSGKQEDKDSSLLTSSDDQSQLNFLNNWLRTHIRDAQYVLKKPLVLTEFGKSVKDPNFSTAQRDQLFNLVYNNIYLSAKHGLFWQLLADGMELFGDGYDVVLSQGTSTANIIGQQGRRLYQVRKIFARMRNVQRWKRARAARRAQWLNWKRGVKPSLVVCCNQTPL